MPRPSCSLSLFSLILLGVLNCPLTTYATLININTASSEELQTLTGIGATYAQRIIDYRIGQGSFQKIEDIKNIAGIGDVTFSKIKDYITVGYDLTTNAGQVASDVSYVATTTSESAHSSQVKSIQAITIDKMKVTAGRNRLATVGAPIEFKAEVNFKTNKSSVFRWSFGDGSIAYGPEITHSYQYAGEYVVVLNAELPEGRLVSRVNVNVISPDIRVVFASENRVEIENTSKEEVNLYGRALVSGTGVFAFPQDTIIPAEQRISFGAMVTGLRVADPSDVGIIVIGDSHGFELMQKVEEESKRKQISMISTKISNLRNKIDQISTPLNTITELVSTSTIGAVPTGALEVVDINYVADSRSSFGWLGAIKKFFLRTK